MFRKIKHFVQKETVLAIAFVLAVVSCFFVKRKKKKKKRSIPQDTGIFTSFLP